MNAHQTERAAYMAAHAILAANTSAPELACPGARRSHAVDVIASIIKDVLALHCGELDTFTDWSENSEDPRLRALAPKMPVRGEKVLHIRAETAAQISS
jgi:hypothetical protein